MPFRPVLRTLLVTLALVVALPAGAARADTPLPSPPERCTATVWTVLRWPGGYQGTVTMTNVSPAPMHGWFVSWQLPAGVALSQTWNGAPMVSGPIVMVHAPTWRTPLPAGETATAGFLATGDPPADPGRVLCG